MTAPVSTPADLRTVVDAIMDGFAQVPDDGWARPAHGLEWDCRDTAAHLIDDFASYAMNLSSREVYLGRLHRRSSTRPSGSPPPRRTSSGPTRRRAPQPSCAVSTLPAACSWP